MKTFTKHILLLALMLFGVAGAAWAQTHQKYTGPVAFSDLVQGDTLAPGFELTGISATDNLYFDGGRYSFNGTPQADPVSATIGTANSLSYPDGNIILIFGQSTFTMAPMVDMTTAGNAWVVTNASHTIDGSEVYLSGITISLTPDPTVPALDELTGNWNFLMPGSNKVVKVTYKAEPALAWTYGNRAIPNDTTITAYRGFELPVIGNIGAIMDHDFLTALMGGTVSLRFGSTNPAVISFTNPNNMYSFRVNGAGECNVYMVFDGNDDFQDDSVAFHAVIANPATLTLAANNDNMGTLEIAESVGTLYNITLVHEGSQEGSRTFTIPASRMPYDTTFSYNANITFAQAYDQMYESVSEIARGDNWITVRISGAFEYGGYYQCELEGGATDDWSISCTAGTGPVPPDGVIAGTAENTYLVLPGTEVNVTATPDSAHYLSRIDSHDTVSNHACGYTFVMPDSDYPLMADFTTKPTLTLAQTDGGTLEAIVPEGGVTAMHLTTDQIPTWSSSNEYAMEADLQQFGFVAVDSAAAAAWTGVPASGYIILVYALAGNQFKAIIFEDGQWSDAYTANFYKAEIYTNSDMIYFTTGTGTSNVIASSTPNTYYIDYGTPVTVVATPDAQHYLVSFSDDDPATERNSNLAVEKTYDSVIADIPNLSANFQAKPTLTLTANDGGTLTLDGYTPASPIVSPWNSGIPSNWANNITVIYSNELPSDFQSVDLAVARTWQNTTGKDAYLIYMTYPNGTTKSIYYMADGSIHTTNSSIYKEYVYAQEDYNTPVFYTTGNNAEVLPAGVVSANATLDTIVVDYGTTLTVTATPDATHYLATLGGVTMGSNTAKDTTFALTATTNLDANFAPKPTLTLAHNDGGEMEIVPAGGVTAIVPPTDKIALWESNYGGNLSENDMPAELGFVAVDQAAAEAWTGVPASGEAMLIYDINGENFYYLGFYNGSLAENSWINFSPATFYSMASQGTLYITTGVTPSNVTATAEPNTYYIDYGTSVTVKATPDATHYLVNFDGTDVRNDNDTAFKTYENITANDTAYATFNAKPTLALTSNEGGTLTLDGITTELDQMMAHLSDPIAPGTQFSAFLQSDGVLKDNVKTLTDAQAIALAQRIAQTTGNNNILVVASTFEFIGDKYLSYGKPDGNNEGGTATMTNSNSIRTIYYVNTFDLLPESYPDGVTAGTTANTYRVDYGTTLTVTATPDAAHYLVRFDNDADTNSNVAVKKTYTNITANTTAEATFNAKPVLTIAQNESWGSVTVPIGLVATDPTPAPTPTAVANPVITGVLLPDGSMQVTMSCTTQDADIYYTTDGVTSPKCDCPAAPEYYNPITFTEPVTLMAAAYTGNDWSAVVTKTISLGYPEGIAQLTDSTYRVDYGATVPVQAIPDTAHYLVRFDNDADTNSNVAVEKTYQNITADVTSEALFAPKPKLTLAKTRTMEATDDWGSVSFNPLQYPYLGSSQNTGPLFLTDEPDVYVVDYGATVTVTADATELHHVANWVDADSVAYPADRITYSAYFVTEPVALFPDSSTLTLTITADTTAKAVFGINSYDVFATAQLDDRDEIGTGTAMGYLNVSYKDIVGTTQTAGPEDTLDYTAQGGSLSTITSTSYYGYRFSGWYDADMDTLMSSVNPLTLTEAAVVEARYTPINYTVTGLSEDDEMGTVTGGGTQPYRTPVSLTAVPERGYHFTGWDNGLSANPLELAAMSDFTVTASFAPNQYTVTVLSGDETMGSASGSTVADFHTTVTLTATPNAHYHFVAWSNGVTDTVTELLVDGDTTVTALFAADEYTITGLSADSTMGSVSGSATVTYPATVTLTATAANCHHFVQWNDGVTANPRTVNALEDLTLTATFAASTYASSEDVTTCDNYTWNGTTYTASGTYTYNTTTLAGCDSTATLHLTLITGIETEEVVEACESYEWHGVVYTQSTGILGAPTYTTTALNGCDSTVTLRLTINHGTTAVETVEACDSYTWNGHTYFSSTTTATYTTEGSNGCDSTTTLHLTLGRSTSGELNVEACESYTWHGVTYTESIVGPTDTNLNTSGCPHVTTLHLTILRNSSSEETVEACDVYNWHGVNRYASGDYVFLSPNAVGCDSTAILHLTILRSTHAEEIAAACDEYEWHGILFTESADTTLHTLNAAGCDSAMTLHLTLYYNSEATDVVTACDSYTWIDGVTYTASTDEPTYTLSGANCSTTVTLNLTVNYSTAGIDEQEAVDSYTWINGITYTASTDQPTFVLTNAAGCDSVVTLHLTITYTPEPVYYNVTLATADATMGSVAPAGTTVIEEGLSFTATATALTGRHFVAWVSNGTVVSNANPYTFVVNDDVELTATFDYDEVIAVLTVNDETMGTTTPAPGTYTFHVGDEATVTATANEHYHFVGWTVNGTPINTQETTYTVTVTPEMAGTTFYVEAVFAQNEGIDDNEGILEATIYAQEGQIVVEGAGNSTVVLYDVTGRRLAVKHSDNAPLRFDIAVSGTYLVKVGNAPAKRIVMVR